MSRLLDEFAEALGPNLLKEETTELEELTLRVSFIAGATAALALFKEGMTIEDVTAELIQEVGIVSNFARLYAQEAMNAKSR